MTWTNTVPKINPGDPVSADVTNAPITALEERTAALNSMLAAVEAGQQLSLRDVFIEAGVEVGDIVYYDPAGPEMKKAVSGWKDTAEEGGTLLPVDESIFVGMVTEICSATTANILTLGTQQLGAAAILNLFGESNPTAGMYYLSSGDPGKITITRSGPSVRCIQYLGDSIVRVLPYTYEPITHQHYCFDLPVAAWTAVGNLTNPPAGATFGIDIDHASITDDLSPLFTAGAGRATFIDQVSGNHIVVDNYTVDANGIWTEAVSIPSVAMEVCSTVADMHDAAILNSITSLSPNVLDIINTNGDVTVAFLAYNAASGDSTEVVLGIDPETHTLTKGHVVRKVLAGPGVSVQGTVDGERGDITISMAEFDNLKITANALNLNNAVTSVEGVHVVTEMPGNRLSTINCSAQLPPLNDASFEAFIWVLAISPEANQASPEAEYSVIPTPIAAGVTPSASAAAAMPAFPSSVTAGDAYYVQSTTAIDLTGASSGSITYTLAADNPSTTIKILATGIILVPVV